MAEPERKTDFKPQDRRLTLAFVLGSAGWFLHLNVSYMLTPESCLDRTKTMLHLVTVACLLVTMIGAWIAWRIRTEIIAAPTALPWTDRTKWIATMIVCLSLSFMLVIVAQEIPNLMLRSCR